MVQRYSLILETFCKMNIYLKKMIFFMFFFIYLSFDIRHSNFFPDPLPVFPNTWYIFFSSQEIK